MDVSTVVADTSRMLSYYYYNYTQILEDPPSSSVMTLLLHLYATTFILFQNGFLKSVKHRH